MCTFLEDKVILWQPIVQKPKWDKFYNTGSFISTSFSKRLCIVYVCRKISGMAVKRMWRLAFSMYVGRRARPRDGSWTAKTSAWYALYWSKSRKYISSLSSGENTLPSTLWRHLRAWGWFLKIIFNVFNL